MDKSYQSEGKADLWVGSENTLTKFITLYHVDNNQRATLVQEIAHISFTALIVLDLTSN